MNTYSASSLFRFFLLAILLSAAFLALVSDWKTAGASEWQHAVYVFFFERSRIQWLTLSVLFLALSILAHRAWLHIRLVRDLRLIRQDAEFPDDARQRHAGRRAERVSECLDQAGPRAADGCNRQLAFEDEKALDRIYRLLGYSIQFMLALGFFGTVFGISRSLFGSFGDIGTLTPEVLKEGLGDFTTNLGTALDTTVLAIIGSLVVSALMTLTNWLEANGLNALETRIADAIPRDVARLDWQVGLAERVEERLRQDLKDIVEILAAESRTAMEGLVDRTAEIFDTRLGDAIDRYLLRFEQHEREIYEKLVEALKEQTDRQGEQLQAALAHEFNNLLVHMRRVPEVSVRYPVADGPDGAARLSEVGGQRK